VEFIEADFADGDAPARVVAAARSALGGPLDVLVVNHARSGSGSLGDLTAEHLDAFLHENVRASLLLVKEFAAQHEGDAGRVVLLTSGIHRGPMTGELGYAVSKGALLIATSTLAAELAERGITVNCINPGPTDRHRLGPRRHRPRRTDAGPALGRARRRGATRGVVVQRRRPLAHRPGDRLRRRLPPLGGIGGMVLGTVSISPSPPRPSARGQAQH
jgi:NAD(P)-dependent dehydrogenase (short-subunit alcohol dehydrogenase family)